MTSMMAPTTSIQTWTGAFLPAISCCDLFERGRSGTELFGGQMTRRMILPDVVDDSPGSDGVREVVGTVSEG